jgi:hypothetical protein
VILQWKDLNWDNSSSQSRLILQLGWAFLSWGFWELHLSFHCFFKVFFLHFFQDSLELISSYLSISLSYLSLQFLQNSIREGDLKWRLILVKCPKWQENSSVYWKTNFWNEPFYYLHWAHSIISSTTSKRLLSESEPLNSQCISSQ